MGRVMLVDGGTSCKCKGNQMHRPRIVKTFWFDFISFSVLVRNRTFLLYIRVDGHTTQSHIHQCHVLAFSVAPLMMAGDRPFLLRNDGRHSHELRSVPLWCNCYTAVCIQLTVQAHVFLPLDRARNNGTDLVRPHSNDAKRFTMVTAQSV